MSYVIFEYINNNATITLSRIFPCTLVQIRLDFVIAAFGNLKNFNP